MEKTIACHGSAHTNAHQDHCGVCLGSPAGWGRLPAPRAPRAPRPRNHAWGVLDGVVSGRVWHCCGAATSDGRCGCGAPQHVSITRRTWRQWSHGAVGPWRPAWRERGEACASRCDCAEEAERERPKRA